MLASMEGVMLRFVAPLLFVAAILALVMAIPDDTCADIICRSIP